MKLKDYRNDFYTFSGKASDLNRQLAFAGIAIIWLFKKDTTAGLSIPHNFLLPAVLIIASLTFDMLHYCAASIIWRVFYRSKEKVGLKADDEIPEHHVWLEIPIWVLFCVKIILVLWAYILILKYFVGAILLR